MFRRACWESLAVNSSHFEGSLSYQQDSATPPLVCILKQVNQVNILTSSLFETQSYTPSVRLYFRFSYQKLVRTFHLCRSCHVLCPSHPPLFQHWSNIWWAVQLIKPGVCSFLQTFVAVSPIGQAILAIAQLQSVFRNVRECTKYQVSYTPVCWW